MGGVIAAHGALSDWQVAVDERPARPVLVGQADVIRDKMRNLARADTTLKASLNGKHKSAACDNAFMATLIKG